MATEITNRLTTLPTQSSKSLTAGKANSVNNATVRQVSAADGQESAVKAPSTPDIEVTEAVSSINDHVQPLNRDILFSVDDGTDRTVIRVLDTETQEVIREIPAKEVLALARYLRESASDEQADGLIIKAQA